MPDPIQLLIAAGAIPVTPFGPSSRYANVAIARYQTSAADPGVAYVLRRFVPQRHDIPIAITHIVRAGDRVDLLAAHYLGDVELHWRVADVHPTGDMLLVTAAPGERIAIPLPPGMAGA